jgi:cobalamin biosynthesis protein CobT
MAIPPDLKFDVRVRERLLDAGLVSQSEVDKHLEALPDMQAQALDVTAKQPALQAEGDRDIVIVRTTGTRPPIAPIHRDDDLDLPIDDDEDDDDDLEDAKTKAKEKIAAKEKADAAAVVEKAKPAPSEDEDEDEDDDDDDDDDDDEDEDEDGEKKPEGTDEGPVS